MVIYSVKAGWESKSSVHIYNGLKEGNVEQVFQTLFQEVAIDAMGVTPTVWLQVGMGTGERN
jgi:hypothetical protein